MIHFDNVIGNNVAYVRLSKDKLYRSIKEMYEEQSKLKKDSPEWHQASGQIKLLSIMLEDLEEKYRTRKIKIAS